MTRQATPLLAALLLLSSCIPTGEGPAEFPAQAPAPKPAAGAPAGEPGGSPGAKVPFDESRLPESIEVGSPADPAGEPAAGGLEAAIELGRIEADRRYDPAFAAARVSSPARIGFDVLSVDPPAGTVQLSLDVAPDGRATLRFGTAGRPTHLVLVRVAPTTAAARDALAADLAGHQETLPSYPVGDLGFALMSGPDPVRVLWVRGNVYLQVRSLAGESVEIAALAVDRHAGTAPAGSPGEGGPSPALRLLGGAPRAGESTEIALEGLDAEFAGTSFSATADAAVSTLEGRIWLLAPTPGSREIEAVAYDRWLRRGAARLTVDVAGE